MENESLIISIIVICCICLICSASSSIIIGGSGYYFYERIEGILAWIRKELGFGGGPCSTCAIDAQCLSGHCVTGAFKCGDANGKLPLDCYCVAGQSQCADGLWCGGFPIKCREKGGDGAYCPLNSEACEDGYYCGPDSKCHSLGHGGDTCLYPSHCMGDICKWNSSMDPVITGGHLICQWDTSGKETWNALSGPDHQGDCYSGTVIDKYHGAANNGKYNCERIPGWQWSGQTSDEYQWAPGGAKQKCRSGAAVPICVKVS